MPDTISRTDRKQIPELLAPAGSPEAFRAAVNAGADAVYLGGRRFGARSFARNFTDEEIGDAVASAHARGVRVYVTVNTLVHDRELAEVAEYLFWLYSAGVDAVLVQDLGVAAIARETVPDLPLHASTQMTVHNADGVRWAAQQGFSRVVLARELSLEEVSAVAESTRDLVIGLEVFAHGALCYCYSGQCLLSSVIGGRSGNRGMCAQPCRKPYRYMSGDRDGYGRPAGLREIPFPDRYLLSTRDLCTHAGIGRLLRSPVVSLKIEGRMKSPGYVAIVVSSYRRALDAAANGQWAPSERDLADLSLAFNRGFTGGYLLKGPHAGIMGRDCPDNRGLLIGTVTGYNVRSGTATIRSSSGVVPAPGDGMVIRPKDSHEEETGFSLNTSPRTGSGTMTLPVPHRVPAGAGVYITASAGLAARARSIVSHAPGELRPLLPIDLAVRLTDDNEPVFEGSIETGEGKVVRVTCHAGIRLETARTRPLTRDQVISQLKKTGGTPFYIRTLALRYEGGLFAPVRELNRARREFLRQAQSALIASYRPSPQALASARELSEKAVLRYKNHPHPEKSQVAARIRLALYADSTEVVTAAAAAGCDAVYFEPRSLVLRSHCDRPGRCTADPGEIKTAAEICAGAGTRLVWKLPRITHQDELDAILRLTGDVVRYGISGIMAENPGAAYAVRRHRPGIPLYGSAGLNVFNHVAVRQLAPDFCHLTLSPELSHCDLTALMNRVAQMDHLPALELIVQGNIEAMVSEDCLASPFIFPEFLTGTQEKAAGFTGIRDARGYIFPFYTDASCRTHILNTKELCLIDHLPAIREIGIGSVAIDARNKTGRYAADMVSCYTEAVRAVPEQDRDMRERLHDLKSQVKRISAGGITAGHFVRDPAGAKR